MVEARARLLLTNGMHASETTLSVLQREVSHELFVKSAVNYPLSWLLPHLYEFYMWLKKKKSIFAFSDGETIL